MANLTVGPNKTYKTISAAVSAAKDRDTILVDAGTYANDYPPVIRVSLAFRAVGGRVVCQSSGLIPNGKGIFIAGGSTGYPSISFDGFDIVGAIVHDNNGAGIRYQAGDLTLTNCKLANCQDGILATPFVKGTGTVRLDRCEIATCGAGDGQSHNLYIGYINTFSLSNSFSHNAKVGHLVKTRALSSTISNCRLYDDAGTSSYAVDCPNAGDLLVSHTTIQQGKAGQNPYVFTYGVGGASNPGRNALITSCTIVNDKAQVLLVLNNVLDDTFPFTDCSFWGVPQTAAALGKGPVKLTNPTWLTARPPLDTSAPYGQEGSVSVVSEEAPEPPPVLDHDDPEADDE